MNNYMTPKVAVKCKCIATKIVKTKIQQTSKFIYIVVKPFFYKMIGQMRVTMA